MEQVCRPCTETDCDATKGLVLADGRCVCSGRKEWRQDEGETGPSCQCPLNTPAEANPETCECPDGRTTDEEGLICSVCIDSNKVFNMITNSCECKSGYEENPVNGSCILFENDVSVESESETEPEIN